MAFSCVLLSFKSCRYVSSSSGSFEAALFPMLYISIFSYMNLKALVPTYAATLDHAKMQVCLWRWPLQAAQAAQRQIPDNLLTAVNL